MFHSAHSRMSSNRIGPNMNRSPVGGDSVDASQEHPTCEEIREKGVRVVGASVGIHNGGACYRYGDYLAVFDTDTKYVYKRHLVNDRYKNTLVYAKAK